MSLPIIDVPIYDLTVPSSGQVIKVRPFNVKEEKLLLMAVEGGKMDDVIGTVKQVINNCILQNDANINIEKLPFFDIDYIFIFLRAKSIGEVVEVNVTCNNTLEDGNRCGNVFQNNLDISKCEVINQDEQVDKNIKLDGSRGVIMKYPAYSIIKNLDSMNNIDKKTQIIIHSIDKIFDAKGYYDSKDYSKEELKDFVEKLTEANYKKLENFIDNFPTFAVRIEAKCTKCGFEHNVRYTDFTDFFLS
jgi:hypothetical protein